MGEEAWRKNHGGGLVKEAPREHSGRRLGMSLESGVAWGGKELLWAKKYSESL